MIVGSLIFAYRGQDFFGGDAITYDSLGQFQLGVWAGDSYSMTLLKNRVSGIGMAYYVGSIYYVIGRNMLAIQFINAVLGAITAPIIFICAKEVFNNVRVSRLAALAVAFSRSLILWSSQGLKDGPIGFAGTDNSGHPKLGQRLTFKYVMVLIFTLVLCSVCGFSLFYMIAAAVAGAFVSRHEALTTSSMVRQFAILYV